MQIKTILFAPLVAAGLASAAPKATKDTNFEILALRSASNIHFSPVQAAQNSLFLQLPNQKAKCQSKSDNAATFTLTSSGELFLYNKAGKTQQIFVDRSGMGQGVLGYSSNKSFPRNSERKGWKVDKYGNLSFDGASLIACPNSIEKAYSIWVSAGITNPGGNKDCIGFSARTVNNDKPNSCTYTNRV